MADANPKVMQMVESELKKNPEISNKELLEKARSIDKGVDKLTARQFNATYPLQVKRAMKPARRKTAKKRARGGKASGKAAGKASGKAAGKAAGRGRRGGARGRAAGSSGDRKQVRKVLVDLARKAAEGDRGALVDVVAGIDDYVDRVMKAAG